MKKHSAWMKMWRADFLDAVLFMMLLTASAYNAISNVLAWNFSHTYDSRITLFYQLVKFIFPRMLKQCFSISRNLWRGLLVK